MNRAAVTGQKRVIAQAVILNVRLEQLAVVLDNDFRLPDEPEDTFAQHLAFPVFFLCLAEQGLNKCLNFPEFFAFSAEELIENQGFTVFDNFTLCSTDETATLHGWLFFICSGHMESDPLPKAMRRIGEAQSPVGSALIDQAKRDQGFDSPMLHAEPEREISRVFLCRF